VSCKQCLGIQSVFGERYVRSDLRRYRRRGPAGTTRLLLDILIAQNVAGQTLLDIGGGVGAIPNALLGAGAKAATLVDASDAYLSAARAEAKRQGHHDQIEYVHGDYVEMAPELGSADVVTLDRVICCYDDMASLVTASASRAHRLFGLVYPRDTWWIRWGVAALNLGISLTGSNYRAFVHPSDRVERIVLEHGLERECRRTLGIWQVVIYRRP
jgi:SAM-dependent methyltransferase